jgi:hypothetical protein
MCRWSTSALSGASGSTPSSTSTASRCLFGSKDSPILALLARARVDELTLLQRIRSDPRQDGLAAAVRATWTWLSDGQHRQLLALWAQAYTRSLTEAAGSWADWLAAPSRTG